MFEWRGFQITTKLSYGIYLVQFAVFHYNISTTRSSSHVAMFKTVVSDDNVICNANYLTVKLV